MPWTFVGATDAPGYPGLPWEDLSDDEMAAAVRDLEPQFVGSHGKIADCGLWKSDAPAGKEAATVTAPPDPAGEEGE